jgi:hypothetical protein
MDRNRREVTHVAEQNFFYRLNYQRLEFFQVTQNRDLPEEKAKGE